MWLWLGRFRMSTPRNSCAGNPRSRNLLIRARNAAARFSRSKLHACTHLLAWKTGEYWQFLHELHVSRILYSPITPFKGMTLQGSSIHRGKSAVSRHLNRSDSAFATRAALPSLSRQIDRDRKRSIVFLYEAFTKSCLFGAKNAKSSTLLLLQVCASRASIRQASLHLHLQLPQSPPP
jgi:hypothetical protein